MLAPALIMFAISLLCIVTGVRHLAEKGYLFNNAWIWAPDEERRALDKRPYYRQSGIIFLLLAGVWLFTGLYVLLGAGIMLGISAGWMSAATVYAVVSQVRIDRSGKQDDR